MLGYLLQSVLITILSDLITYELPPPSSKPIWIGLLTSFSLVFAATAPYLKLLGQAEPIRILRNDFAFNLETNVGIYSLAAITLTVFLLILLEDITLVISILIGMTILIAVLSLLGYSIVWMLSKYVDVSGSGWRLGLKNISRRRN